MKRHLLKKKLFSGGIGTIVIMAASIVLMLGGCGLPDREGAAPDAPSQNEVKYTSGTSNAVDRYFEFRPSGNTKVFYRVYASDAALNNDITTIKTAIQSEIDSNVAQGSYNRIVSLGYRELDTDKHENYLTRDVAKIRIRLFDEGSGLWPAGVFTVDDVESTTETIGKPLRRGLDNKGFGFFYTGNADKESNPMPVNGDTDTNFSGYTSGSIWYVNAYAVTVGQGIDFSLSYSRIVELGYIIISQSGAGV